MKKEIRKEIIDVTFSDELIWKIIEVTAHEGYDGQVWSEDVLLGTKREIINDIRKILEDK